MGAMASEIISLTIVYSTVYSGTDHRKHQSSSSLACVRGIPRWQVNSLHKGPVTRKMFIFDDVIISTSARLTRAFHEGTKHGWLNTPFKWQSTCNILSLTNVVDGKMRITLNVHPSVVTLVRFPHFFGQTADQMYFKRGRRAHYMSLQVW